MSRMNIHTKEKRFPVAPDLYGLFFEDISRAGDGGLFDAVDDDHVQQPVVDLGLWGDGDAPAEAPAVGGAGDQRLVGFGALRRDLAEPFGRVVHNGQYQRRQVGCGAPEPLHGGVAAQYVHVDAGADGVDAPHPGAVQVVGGLRRAGQYEAERPGRVRRDARRGREVVAAAAGDQPHARAGRVAQAVEHLVQRAVAAHGDDVRFLGVRRELTRDGRGVAAVPGHVKGVRRVPKQGLDDLPGALRPTVSRLGIVDEVQHGSSPHMAEDKRFSAGFISIHVFFFLFCTFSARIKTKLSGIPNRNLSGIIHIATSFTMMTFFPSVGRNEYLIRICLGFP